MFLPFVCNCVIFDQNMQYISTNGSLSNLAELARVQTHGNEHRKKPIIFKALLVSTVLGFFVCLLVLGFWWFFFLGCILLCLFAFGSLFLNKVKVSPDWLWFVPRACCIKTRTKPFAWLEWTVAATETIRFWHMLSKYHCAQVSSEYFSRNFWVSPVSL